MKDGFTQQPLSAYCEIERLPGDPRNGPEDGPKRKRRKAEH